MALRESCTMHACVVVCEHKLKAVCHCLRYEFSSYFKKEA